MTRRATAADAAARARELVPEALDRLGELLQHEDGRVAAKAIELVMAFAGFGARRNEVGFALTAEEREAEELQRADEEACAALGKRPRPRGYALPPARRMYEPDESESDEQA